MLTARPLGGVIMMALGSDSSPRAASSIDMPLDGPAHDTAPTTPLPGGVLCPESTLYVPRAPADSAPTRANEGMDLYSNPVTVVRIPVRKEFGALSWGREGGSAIVASARNCICPFLMARVKRVRGVLAPSRPSCVMKCVQRATAIHAAVLRAERGQLF
jgi:hypothetical protein